MSGVFYGKHKAHIFRGIPEAQIAVPDEGFPSRGIQSDLGTATDKPGDYHINPGMKKLPRFIQDTDNMLQKIEKNRNCRACIWCTVTSVTWAREDMWKPENSTQISKFSCFQPQLM